MATFSPEESPLTESVGAERRRRRPILPTIPPLARFVMGVAILAPLSVIAFLQPTRTDPFEAPSWLSVDWWRYPLEWNARNRLPTFTSFVLPLLGVLAVIWLGQALLKRPELVVKDSPKFVEALQIWHPLLFGRLSTPRATKRFMNFVRYLAMRQRPQTGSHPPATQFFKRLKAGFLGGKTATDVKDEIVAASSNPKPIPDEVLVALAALQQLNPAYFTEWPKPVRSSHDVWPLSVVDNPFLQDHLEKALKEHEAKFGDLSILQTYREQFLEMTARVKVR